MSTKAFLILVFSVCLSCQAQTIIKGNLVDKARKRPIPYATIKFINKPTGTFTDSLGYFNLEAAVSDSILISSIGFFPLKTTCSFKDTIFLDPVSKELSPVTAFKKKFISSSILGIASKSDYKWGLIPGDEFAQKINLNRNGNQYCKIKKVMLAIEPFNKETPLLLHIYSVDPLTGMPSNELLSRNYFFEQQNFKKGKVTIDINSENLIVDEESIFVSLQWLVPKQTNTQRPFLKITTAIKDRQTYSRTLAYNTYDWFLMPLYSNKTSNTLFQIEIDTFDQ